MQDISSRYQTYEVLNRDKWITESLTYEKNLLH